MVFISYNVNGIRAAAKKCLFTWVLINGADCIGLQVVKAKNIQADCTEIGRLSISFIETVPPRKAVQ